MEDRKRRQQSEPQATTCIERQAFAEKSGQDKLNSSEKSSGSPARCAAIALSRANPRQRGLEPTYVQRLLADYSDLVRSQRLDG